MFVQVHPLTQLTYKYDSIYICKLSGRKNVILHILMYNVISDFSAATPASEGRVKGFRSQWIYTQFDRSNSTGHKSLVKLGVNSLR